MLERLTLYEMWRKLRAKEVTARELLEAHFARIAKVNPRVNAFTTVLEEQAFAAIENPAKPLLGLPVTVKDCFDVAGAPTMCGSVVRRESGRAGLNANAVSQLRNAGAVILGKTNVPELCCSYETDNHITGRTNNPWDLERTPGGSSGGEAAAIASFCSPGGLGTDGGGSIRVPAHFCGIVGFKPTHRRIGGTGIWPAAGGPFGMLTAPGILARTVQDAYLLFRVSRGADLDDPAWTPGRSVSTSVRRIGVMRQFYRSAVHPAVSQAVDRAAAAFASLGYEVEEFVPRGLERAPNVWSFFFGEFSPIRRLLGGRESEAHWTATEFLRDAPRPDADAVAAHYEERDALRTTALAQMRPYSAILMPPCSVPAFRHKERRYAVGDGTVSQFAAMAYATLWNLTGFPALVLPFGTTSDGLPVGVQLAGVPFQDEALLRLGEILESARGPQSRVAEIA